MPRPVSIRVSYRDDAAYLLRLEGAVSKDVRQSDSWRRLVLRHLHAAATLFLQADASGMDKESSRSAAGKAVAKRGRSRRPEPQTAA